MIDYQARETLSDQTARRVFREIAEERSIRQGKLVKRLLRKYGQRSTVPSGGARPPTTPSGLNRRDIKQSLNRLIDARLIKLKPSSVERLNTYYITSEGLRAKRELANV